MTYSSHCCLVERNPRKPTKLFASDFRTSDRK